MTRYKKGKKYSTSRYGPLQLAYDGICYMIAKHKKNTKKTQEIKDKIHYIMDNSYRENKWVWED